MLKITSHHDIASRSVTQKLLLSCGIIGSLLFTVMYFIEGALHPGYDWIHQTISSLELVSYGWVQQVNFFVFAAFLLCFAVGIRRELVGGIGAVAFPILVGIEAVGLIISGVFVTEPLHSVGDYVTFLSVLAGFFVLAWRFAREREWGWGWTLYSILSAFLMMGFLAAFGAALGHGGPLGLYERLAGLVRTLWTIPFVGRLLIGVQFLPRQKVAARSEI